MILKHIVCCCLPLVWTVVCCVGKPSGETWKTVFAQETWYMERPEKEQILDGILRRRAEQAGPGSRMGLLFTLDQGNKTIPIYAVGADSLLITYVGKSISFRAKIIDLSPEGFAVEAWPGYVKER